MALAVPLGAQDAPELDLLDFESVVEQAISSSGIISLLRDTLADQLEEAGFFRYLQGIGISVSGSVNGSFADPLSGSGDASLTANIELFPQLSINGSLSVPYSETEIQQLEGSIGLYITPLADAAERPRDLLAIEQTRVQLESAIQAASYAAISQLLSAAIAERQAQLDEMERFVADKALGVVRSLYEKDQATEEAYTAAKNTLRSRKHDLLLSRLEAERALESLAQIIAVPIDQLQVPAFENLRLGDLANQAAAFLDSPDIDLLAEHSTFVRLAFLDVQEAEIDLSGARGFSPTISVAANTTLPSLDYSVGAQFGFSISDFDLKARDDARRNLSHTAVTYENVLSMAHFDVREAVLELEIALEELEAAWEALAPIQLDFAEMRYFAEQGEATELALAQSELAVRIAEYAVVGAQVEVAGKWFAIGYAQF